MSFYVVTVEWLVLSESCTNVITEFQSVPKTYSFALLDGGDVCYPMLLAIVVETQRQYYGEHDLGGSCASQRNNLSRLARRANVDVRNFH